MKRAAPRRARAHTPTSRRVRVCVALPARAGGGVCVCVRSCALPLGRRLNGVNALATTTLSDTHELLSLRAVSSSSSARSPKASIACSRGISGAWP